MTLMETAQLMGNFGEFFGAFAVVATLFYLAVQVRHGKEATLANTKSVDQAERVHGELVVTRELVCEIDRGNVAANRSPQTLSNDVTLPFL